MVDEKALTVSLEEFGLSKYEAQAYVTLVSRGTISASAMTYYSGLPRTKIYPTLLKLEGKKLAMISKSKPIMYTPIAPEDAFDNIVQDQIHKVNAMNTLVSNLKKINENSRKSRGAEERRYFHLAANSTLEQLRTMIEGSKGSVHMMADQWGIGLLAECKEQLLSVVRRNLEVRAVVQPSQVGSEAFKTFPDGVKIRVSEIIQNCFVFDETEVLLIDSANGKGAVFSSTDILGANQTRLFSHIWKGAVRTDGLTDMTKVEAQEIYRIIRIVDENGLNHMLDSSMISKNQFDFVKLLEKNGISLKGRSIDDVIEIIDSALQIVCAGHASFDAKARNISVESKMNSGHSLPWIAILDGYLQGAGYKTRMTYQNQSQKGEKVHIKLHS